MSPKRAKSRGHIICLWHVVRLVAGTRGAAGGEERLPRRLRVESWPVPRNHHATGCVHGGGPEACPE
eukprot:3260649-Lingulodinium_polyedra.AAC.1